MVRPEIFENDIGNLFNLYYCIMNRLRAVWGGGGGTVQSHHKPDDPD